MICSFDKPHLKLDANGGWRILFSHRRSLPTFWNWGSEMFSEIRTPPCSPSARHGAPCSVCALAPCLQAAFTNSLHWLFFPVNIRSLSVISKSCRLVPNGLCLVKTRIYSFLFFQKRVCKPLEAIPNEVDARLIDCAMELDSKQKVSSGCGPWATKTKQNSMVCLHRQHIYLLEGI